MRNITRKQLRILAGACVFQCALLGTMTNSVSLLMTQMRVDYEISMTQVSLYNTVKCIMSAVSAGGLTLVFYRLPRPIFMVINNLVLVAGFLILTIKESPLIFYGSACMFGMSFATSGVMISSVLKEYFPSMIGTATGLAMAFSGIGGAIFNPVMAWLCGMYGWRVTVILLGILTVGMTIAGVAAMFWGCREGEAESGTEVCREGTIEKQKKAADGISFVLCSLSLLGGAFLVAFNSFVAIYAQAIGYSVMVSASLVSAAMVGNIVGKMLFGIACDLWGIWKTMTGDLALLTVSFILLAVYPEILLLQYCAMLLFGLVFALFMMSIYQFAGLVFRRDYEKKAIGMLTGVNNAFMAVASLAIGILYDITGAFHIVLYLGAASCLLSIAAIRAITIRIRRKKYE